MKLWFDLSQYCTDAVRGAGEALLREGRLTGVREEETGTSARRLCGRCPDGFNFVDHPRLTVSAEGDRLLSFRCDCPEARRTDEFCAHCAALALSAGAAALPRTARSTGAAQTEAAGAAATGAEPEDGTQIVDFSYAFANSPSGMYPGIENPQIPLERFQLFYQGLYAQALYEGQGAWGGNCYGVSSTSAMFYQQGNGVTLSDFARRVAFPGQLRREDENCAWGLTLLGFIEALQISQYHPNVSQFRSAIWDVSLDEKLKIICQAVQSLQETGVVQLVLDVWQDRNGTGGHCILPYRWEKTGECSERLTIYDPNWPQRERYMELTTDRQGRYVDWRFPMSDDLIYSGKTGGLLTFLPLMNAQETWDGRGKPVSPALFTARCGALTLCDADGAEVARVRGGVIEPLREDVLPIRVSSGKAGAEPSFWVKPGVYRVRSEVPEGEEMAFRFLTGEQSIETKTRLRELIVELDDETETCAVLVPREELQRERVRETPQEQEEPLQDQEIQEEQQEDAEETDSFRDRLHDFWVRLRSFGKEAVLDGLKSVVKDGVKVAAVWVWKKLFQVALKHLVPIVLSEDGTTIQYETIQSDVLPEHLRRFLPQEKQEQQEKQKIKIPAAAAPEDQGAEEVKKE